MVNILIVFIGFLFGGLPTLYVIWEAIHTISQKVYKKVKYGSSLYD